MSFAWHTCAHQRATGPAPQEPLLALDTHQSNSPSSLVAAFRGATGALGPTHLTQSPQRAGAVATQQAGACVSAQQAKYDER
eukprot:CAMPEP_0180081956 /NCGR_PEP_ID=MMETSP0985-20121206/18434_1 /TAXON_ID=483367 /ORGANISM="non described non described, Strain CCMP 2436" /LENGTH=81 /DNA_ID=CAMNT_0022015245 /DNA_START=1440 /DNA_END=1682 /DNA_ORIENTATION=+